MRLSIFFPRQQETLITYSAHVTLAIRISEWRGQAQLTLDVSRVPDSRVGLVELWLRNFWKPVVEGWAFSAYMELQCILTSLCSICSLWGSTSFVHGLYIHWTSWSSEGRASPFDYASAPLLWHVFATFMNNVTVKAKPVRSLETTPAVSRRDLGTWSFTAMIYPGRIRRLRTSMPSYFKQGFHLYFSNPLVFQTSLAYLDVF